MQEFINIQVKY